jgi:DNA-binding CsgD family transcriptional regulator
MLITSRPRSAGALGGGMVARQDLSERDVRAFSDLLCTLAEPVTIDEYPSRVVAALPAFVRALFTGWNEVNTEEERVFAVVEPAEHVPADAEEIFVRNMHEHPVLAHFQQTHDGRPYAISDFLSTRDFHRLGLYQELFKPMGTEDQVSLVLPGGPSVVVGVAINRATRSFSDRDRFMLNLARPDVFQGYRNALAYSRLLRALASLERAVDSHGEAVLVLGPRNRIEAATGNGHQLLKGWFGWTGAGGLPPEISTWLHETRRCATPGPATPLVVERDERRLVVRLLPADDRGSGEALLMADERLGLSTPALQALGLSPREAQILAMVAEGETNAAIATCLGLSARTVQTYLRHIFSKLGVENRTAAARVAIDATLHTAGR